MRTQIKLLIALAPLTALASSSPLEGCYSKLEQVTLRYEQPEKVVDVINRLSIKRTGGNTYSFSLSLTGDNHHVCGAEGKAKLINGRTGMMLQMIPAPMDKTEPEEMARCQLGLTIMPSEISVSEIAGNCAEHFLCGQGMSFSHTSFPRKSRQPLSEASSCSSTP